MPITHATIPAPPDKVGQEEWAEEHTLPEPGEILALTTGSAVALFQPLGDYATSAEVDAAVAVLAQNVSTTYARQASAVTTAQLAPYITSASADIFLTSASASTVYARQVSAVTTAQLSVYLTSASAIAIYLLAQDASTTYARQASAVTTAQLNNVSCGVLTSGTVATARLGTGSADNTVFLRGDQTWASPGAGGGITETSADAKYGIIKVVVADVSSATTGSLVTVPELIVSVCASVAYRLEYNIVWRSSATTTGIGVLCSVTPTPSVFMFAADIYAQATDGTGTVFSGYASANGDLIIATTCNMAAADLPITGTGTIVTGSEGQVQFCFRSEVSNSNVVIRRGSSLKLTRLGGV